MGAEPDFGGYATKAGLKCADGLTIMPDAFKHMDGQTVPLVWQHTHNDPENVLGHALLEARPDGLYAYGFFNDTAKGQATKQLVMHKDIDSMSIFANRLVQKSKQVFHGFVREVSLVISGANPGAKIDFLRVQHGEGDFAEITELDDEAFITTGETGLDLEFSHSATSTSGDGEEEQKDLEHADNGGETLQDVYNTLDEKQRALVEYMLSVAKESGAQESQQAKHSDTEADEVSDDTSTTTTDSVEKTDGNDEEGDLTHQEGTTVSRNVFEKQAGGQGEDKTVLSHEDVKGIFSDAMKLGSLREAVDGYMLKHGITNIDELFPDAKLVTNEPELDKRRTEWVSTVLGGVRRSPFSRVKTIWADLTQDEARAKGYIKGHFKKEEWFGLTKRTTTPTTVYKKQKLDRDDILDITDFDMVNWLKAEIRLMLEEEIGRAILIGDGRDIADEDKIKDPAGASSGDGIRSILNDHEAYVTTVNVNLDDSNSNYEEVVDAVIDGMEFYKGTGTPTLFTTIKNLNMFFKAKDTTGRRYYANRAEVAQALGVDKIVTVDVMNEATDVVGIIVNLNDYNIGADKGGEVTLFDDFDLNYNQYLYLMETRISGGLVKLKSAIVIKKTAASNVLVAPTDPTFVPATGVVTIPTKTGVVYKNGDTDATLTAGAQSALAPGATLNVIAVPASGYYFETNAEDQWSFKRPSA